MNICICITESYGVHLKLTQHCKSTILQKKVFFKEDVMGCWNIIEYY